MIHKVGDRFVISSRDVWMPGSYESERAARMAFRLSDDVLQRLQDDANAANGGCDGVITFEALKGAAAAARRMR